jgi:hypothetical protein
MKIIYNKKLDFFDEEINSKFFKEFIELQIKINRKFNFKDYYKILSIYDNYHHLLLKSYFFRNYKKNEYLYGWSYYLPIFNNTLVLWENSSLLKFKKNIEYKVCSISNYDIANEYFFYNGLKNNLKFKNYIYNLELSNDNTYFNELINNYKKLDKNINIININNLNYKNNELFDIIYLKYYLFNFPGYLSYINSGIINIFLLIFSINFLKKNGTLIYNIGLFTTNFTIEIITLLQKLFKKVDIIRPKIYIAEKTKGFILYCYQFNSKYNIIDEIFNQLIIKYPKYGLEWKSTKKYEEFFPNGNAYSNNINKSHIYNKNFEYPSIINFIDKNKFEENKKFIKALNEKYFSDALFDITRIQELLENKMDDELKQKYLNKQYFATINWAKEFDWKLKPNLNLEPFIDEKGLEIIKDIFGYQYLSPLKLQYKNSGSKTTSNKYFNEILNLKNNILLSQAVIDTRDPNKYELIKQVTDIYRKNLHPIITNKYNAQNVSQAWQKMYEMLSIFNLFNKNSKNLNTFHICEAPGSFIISLNHYIKTMTNIKNWNWKAQSLHEKAGAEFFNTYKFIEKYPNNWDFGPNNTGDITNIDNFYYYVNYSRNNNIDLITSDCGIPIEERGNKMGFLNFVFMYFFIKASNIGSNILFKMFLEVDETEIKMLYLISTLFDEIYFYKPLQNPRSAEIYVFCKNKKIELDENIDKKLEKILKDRKLYEIEINIPGDFNKKLYEIFNFYVENFEKSIENKIYYLDNLYLMDDIDKDLWKKSIETANLLWLKRFPIKKIKDNDKFNL